MALITCSKLSIGYEREIICSDLNFTVEQGDYLCIVGENGSGKTTLMRTLLNLRKPMAGEIITGDGLKPNEIGYLPQQSQVQKDFPASVEEIVLSGCLGRKGRKPFYSAVDRKTVDRNLERLGISALRKKCFRELSGGQQQRVLLARALSATEKVLLLDEPVTGLDTEAALSMYSLIEKFNKENGLTVIMISHDLEASLKYATHILNIGEKIFFGTKDEYLAWTRGESAEEAGVGAEAPAEDAGTPAEAGAEPPAEAEVQHE
ncbi:MAG: metal ABC transporter ATP-binding protein [Lachnospiraceae bacterium]|nr:metal ABC transporter ATP-binding protein [Lachnospiraceae bacterium]